MGADEPVATIRLAHADDKLLEELKGHLQLQFNRHSDLRAKARVETKPDGKSQSLGGAEAFLLVFGGSAVVEAARLAIAEFSADRDIECRLDLLPDRDAESDKAQPRGVSSSDDRQ